MRPATRENPGRAFSSPSLFSFFSFFLENEKTNRREQRKMESEKRDFFSPFFPFPPPFFFFPFPRFFTRASWKYVLGRQGAWRVQTFIAPLTIHPCPPSFFPPFCLFSLFLRWIYSISIFIAAGGNDPAMDVRDISSPPLSFFPSFLFFLPTRFDQLAQSTTPFPFFPPFFLSFFFLFSA